MDAAGELIHGTAIACGGKAALIRGPSKSGKSDLALRCLALAPTPLLPNPARLIADDQVSLTRRGSSLIAAAPSTIKGKLEIRGLGIIDVAVEPESVVAFVADLVPPEQIERLPDPWPTTEFMGLRVPILRLWPHAASAPIVLLTALHWGNLPTVAGQS